MWDAIVDILILNDETATAGRTANALRFWQHL